MTRFEAVVPGCSGEIQFPCHGQARPLALSEKVDAKNGFTTYTGPHCCQESCTVHNQIPRYTIKYPRMTCRYPWTQLDNNIEVFCDANFAGSHSTRNSTVGGAATLSGQFVKAWSKTLGVLDLSSGESELTAVVRAATERLGFKQFFFVVT